MTLTALINSQDCTTARCSPSQYLDEVVDMMALLSESSIAVTKANGAVVGILTDSDIMRAINAHGTKGYSICGQHVDQWMSEDVLSCPHTTRLSAAAETMSSHNIRHLIVMRDDRFAGIISLTTVLNRLHTQTAASLANIRDMLVPPQAYVAA